MKKSTWYVLGGLGVVGVAGVGYYLWKKGREMGPDQGDQTWESGTAWQGDTGEAVVSGPQLGITREELQSQLDRIRAQRVYMMRGLL